jgi:hypothetical protein
MITRPRSPTVCKIIIKLKNQRPGPKGAVEPVKKKKMTSVNDLRYVILSIAHLLLTSNLQIYFHVTEGL